MNLKTWIKKHWWKILIPLLIPIAIIIFRYIKTKNMAEKYIEEVSYASKP